MRRLPSGTVTFLFTDIEGSTKLVQALGDGFREVLEDHNRLLREAFSKGVEVRMEGDAFFIAFTSAADAVEAAIDGQRALAAHPWPAGIRLSVRMGLHTGEGTPGGADYVGIEVHRAARISAAGHGGQILISEATRNDASEALDLATRRLGGHRFKDLEDPIEVHQVVVEQLRVDFPPIRSIATPPNNLPALGSGFVGRSEEIALLLELLEPGRVVTLTGPGGVGKTRLALDVATRALHRFGDGGFFVPLDSLTDPDLVAASIAEHIGLTFDPGAEPVDALTSHLSEQEVLLVLDNFEQVLDAAPAVARIRSATPGLAVLVTSQEVLRVNGETVFRVQPLDLPPADHLDLDDLLRSDAAALFIERARAADDSFEISPSDVGVIAQIVTELDGLPLALELAASRLRVLGLEGLRSRIGDRFRMLRGGNREAPDRHRTLLAAIEWSHDLLDEPERRALSELSVMIGGFTLETAEAVLGPDTALDAIDLVESLLDKSLLQRATRSGETRFSMLRSIREFSGERLRSSGRADAVMTRLAEHLAELAVEAMPRLDSERQAEWLERRASEHDNIRSVIEWSGSGGDVDLGLLIAGSIWRFHHRRGHLPEAQRNLEMLLAMPGASDHPRAVALNGLAGIVYWLGDFEKSVELYRQAIELFESLGETERVAYCLYGMSTAMTIVGDIRGAVEHAKRSQEAYVACGSEEGIRRVVPAYALASWMAGHLEVAAEQWARAAELFREAGDISEELQTCVSRAIIDFQLGHGGIGERVIGCVERLVAYGDMSGALMGLEFLARVVVAEQPETALRIAGGARKLRASYGGYTPETVGLTSTWEEARPLLGPERTQQLSRKGEELDLDGLMDLARAVPGAPD
jgi:predicted ATPase/class 3 adenylate cyclase